MRTAVIRAGKTLGVVAVAACPLFVHAALATGQWTRLAMMLSALQLAVLGGVMLMRSTHRYRWWVGGAGILSILLVISWQSAQQSLLATAGISHALIYIGLLAIFGSTLLAGREPLITTVVRKLHGPLPPHILVYTRRTTWAWCCFFAGQLVCSLALFLLAPIGVWSFFINVVNFPLLVLMFIGEYAYRRARVRNRPQSKLADVIRAFKHANPRRSSP